MNRYLLFVSKAYSFAILRPLAQAIAAQGDTYAWFVHGIADAERAIGDDRLLADVAQVRTFDPQAVFVPGNWVADFFPGVKVQVFHGFGIEKKGHFRIRGFFDLYCTHGPLTTAGFNELRRRHRHFSVVETGWPKVDPLFTPTEAAARLRAEHEAPIVLYAPTHSPSLTSAPALQHEIDRLSRSGRYRWLVKFHPKADSGVLSAFSAMQTEHLQLFRQADILPALQAADVLLSDTSSVVTEFLLLDKPVVTYRTAQPAAHVLNIDAAAGLEAALDHALTRPAGLMESGRDYVRRMHPYNDGLSSQRVLAATKQFIETGGDDLVPKPLNLKRRLGVRRKLHYYHWR